MQLSQLTTAVMAGSERPGQWLLLPIPKPEIFGIGMAAGVVAVALARGWLRWRGPKRAAQADTGLAHRVSQPASAPVSVAARPAVTPASPAVTTEPAVRATEPPSAVPPAATEEPDVAVAVRELLTSLENLKVTLTTGRPGLVDRFLSAAVTELASGAAPCGPCDLVLVGFPEPTRARASGLTMRRGDVAAALDVIAARAVRARRRLADHGLTVLVSRVAPTSAELALLVDLVGEPGRLAALLPGLAAERPPGPASVLELATGEPASLVTTLVAGSEPEPARGEAGLAQRPSSLRIGVLGQLTINGQPGALLPAQTQLIVALALHGENGLFGRQLCELLGSDADHPKPADSLRQLIARTRRQLGRADDDSEWIEHLGHGRYALHKQARLDWREFERLTDHGIASGDASQLAAALAMVRGQPFAGCYYWWLDIELIDAVSSKIVTAATTLAELALGRPDPAAAARAARIGLVADLTSEQLWRLLMRAEHAAGNLAGVREAWSRCVDAVGEIAADGEPEPDTAALYHQLLDR
jgi:DNA-binding SARP family transcriptional activator